MNRVLRVGDVAAYPGELRFGTLQLGYLNDSTPLTAPIMVMNGSGSGPVLWLGCAVHGIEIAGCEVIRQLMREILEPRALRGAVVAAPILNLLAFRASERHNPLDRRDMNRVFSAAELSASVVLADTLYSAGVSHADVVVDYHSCNPPSINFTIVPGAEGKVAEQSLDLARAYGVTVCYGEHDYGGGTLTTRAVRDGKPAVVVELTFSRRIERSTVLSGVRGTLNIMKRLGMIEGEIEPQSDILVLDGLYRYRTVSVTRGGLVALLKDVGDAVRAGEPIALLRNPYGDIVEEVRSPVDGYVIAFPMAGNQALGTGDKLAYLAYSLEQA